MDGTSDVVGAPEDAADSPPRAHSTAPRLVLASCVMLFLELALIRWLGANIVHLSYFTNFVLLGSFLGIGLGFLVARRSWSVLPWTPVLLAVLVVGVRMFPVSIDRADQDVIYFTSLRTSGPPPWLVLPIVFLLVAAVMAGPAEAVGRCFALLPPLTAYRWDLIGSLAGIGLFTVLSFVWAPSVVWGVLVAVALLVLVGGRSRWPALVASALMVGALLLETTAAGVSWSPYYKVTTRTDTSAGTTRVFISVNGVPHQSMSPATWKLTRSSAIYAAPYAGRTEPPRDVLVVGAGSGSDVAIALHEGARHVDAVDIDPRLVQIGVEGNPDGAYQDPRVTRHINDGRAFLQNTHRKYDLILFALPDSLALVSGASQIRLESFLFTEEALRSARDHLTQHGVFAMYNYYRQAWLIDRLGGTAAEAFGHAPCIDVVSGATAVVSAARDTADQYCPTSAHRLPASYPAPVHDDAPFLYYAGGMLPSIYLWTLGGILLISLLLVRAVGGPLRRMRPYADLFFMGAAFLLLETKNIATFANLFGTTWIVNAMVFAGVLVSVLAAVEVTRLLPTPRLPVVYGLVAAALAVAYVVSPEVLLGLSFWPRLVVATVIAFVPIFVANIAFAKRFAESDSSPAAFGVNLLGAILGGCLEYAALLTGYRNLLLVVAGLYLLAFVLKPGSRTAAGATP